MQSILRLKYSHVAQSQMLVMLLVWFFILTYFVNSIQMYCHNFLVGGFYLQAITFPCDFQKISFVFYHSGPSGNIHKDSCYCNEVVCAVQNRQSNLFSSKLSLEVLLEDYHNSSTNIRGVPESCYWIAHIEYNLHLYSFSWLMNCSYWIYSTSLVIVCSMVVYLHNF